MYICFKMYIFQISLPQNAMFFSKKAPAMNLSVLEVMAMVQWCRCLLVMSPQYPPSGAWALQQALPSTKATRETGWAMTAMNLEPFVFWEGELGRWHPLWRRVGVPEQKSPKTRWFEENRSRNQSASWLFGGGQVIFVRVQWSSEAVFLKLSLKCSIVRNGSKWPKKEGNMFFQTTLPWRNESGQTLHNGLLHWKIPVDMAHRQKHILR